MDLDLVEQVFGGGNGERDLVVSRAVCEDGIRGGSVS
jgi:hypothetical protein